MPLKTRWGRGDGCCLMRLEVQSLKIEQFWGWLRNSVKTCNCEAGHLKTAEMVL